MIRFIAKPRKPVRRWRAVTLIAGIIGKDGLILSADSEESIAEPNALRTQGQKLHVIHNALSNWKVLIAGAGDTDYIGMAKDFIAEKVHASVTANDAQIVEAIRKAINEM